MNPNMSGETPNKDQNQVPDWLAARGYQLDSVDNKYCKLVVAEQRQQVAPGIIIPHILIFCFLVQRNAGQFRMGIRLNNREEQCEYQDEETFKINLETYENRLAAI